MSAKIDPKDKTAVIPSSISMAGFQVREVSTVNLLAWGESVIEHAVKRSDLELKDVKFELLNLQYFRDIRFAC